MAHLLSINNLSKSYENHKALQNVTFDIPKGKIFGLLGPNGAGKTSLIRIITRITAPDEGTVLFEGTPLNAEHVASIGYLPEERGLYKKMKVGEQVLYLAQLKGLSLSEAKEKVKEWFVRFEIQQWWNKNVEDLSKGMAQKVQFIATVVHDPKLIILDEPFTGFDPINANLIKNEILRLKEKGASIIFSTHRMESVEELCDEIALINKSKLIIAGPTKSIRSQFKKNLFKVGLKADRPISETESIKIIGEKEGVTELQISGLKDSSSPNEILRGIMEYGQLTHFEELIPSMNEIFIELVGGTEA